MSQGLLQHLSPFACIHIIISGVNLRGRSCVTMSESLQNPLLNLSSGTTEMFQFCSFAMKSTKMPVYMSSLMCNECGKTSCAACASNRAMSARLCQPKRQARATYCPSRFFGGLEPLGFGSGPRCAWVATAARRRWWWRRRRQVAVHPPW